jgi:hypothetical protein
MIATQFYSRISLDAEEEGEILEKAREVCSLFQYVPRRGALTCI